MPPGLDTVQSRGRENFHQALPSHDRRRLMDQSVYYAEPKAGQRCEISVFDFNCIGLSEDRNILHLSILPEDIPALFKMPNVDTTNCVIRIRMKGGISGLYFTPSLVSCTDDKVVLGVRWNEIVHELLVNSLTPLISMA